MPNEVYFRNPYLYVRELVECGEYKIAWDRGMLVKRKIDPDKFASLYYGKTYPWKALLIGEQGTAEIDGDHTVNNPKAVYPTWVYGEPIEILEEILASPPGLDPESCSDMTVDVDERPVFGQKNMVVITEIPSGSTGPGRQFLRHLLELQEEYPESIIHIHGLYSYKLAFGLGFTSVDVEPRTSAAHGNVDTPSGSVERWENLQKHPQWATVVGFKPAELSIPRNRCIYNIKSAVWASENYTKILKFKLKDVKGKSGYKPAVDSKSSDSDFKPVTTLSSHTGSKKIMKGDKFACDTCSLKNECKYFRAGAVCSVPGSEPTELARYFKTRDAEQIIDGLGTLLAANTVRLQRGMSDEDTFGDLNPDVTKVMGQVFEQGVKLAKLLDPNLRGGPKIQVNVGNNSPTTVQGQNPRQSVAAAMRELEVRGIKREDITAELIQGVLVGPAADVVEGIVLDDNDNKDKDQVREA